MSQSCGVRRYIAICHHLSHLFTHLGFLLLMKNFTLNSKLDKTCEKSIITKFVLIWNTFLLYETNLCIFSLIWITRPFKRSTSHWPLKKCLNSVTILRKTSLYTKKNIFYKFLSCFTLSCFHSLHFTTFFIFILPLNLKKLINRSWQDAEFL